ncbi:CAP domain-containing protein [Ammoniphilus sp. YIM 78166]|uniref:CAP domain-containing protein n=1 Tax=Ammoniphilus sp. YIM 78166 TaxID=1644106 RepID=UPI00106F52B0|nr:CAP domain-containing protein [Ammoniphilus sp. YIM 78166]
MNSLKHFLVPTLLFSLALSGCGAGTQGALPAENPPVNVQNVDGGKTMKGQTAQPGRNTAKAQHAQSPGAQAGPTNQQWPNAQWHVITWPTDGSQTAPWQPAPAPTPAPAPAPTPAPAAPATPAPAAGLSAQEQQMLNLVNQARQANGLSPLRAHTELTRLARVKSQDMINGNYFSHQSPTHGSPFDMIRNAGIGFQTAGENIAGNQSVDGAHTSLMNSPGHRANILSNEYNYIGIGIVSGGAYGNMFTQMFIKQ